MSKKASLEIDGKSFDLPIINGTEKEQAINISSLRASSGGLITIDPGFKNTGSCQSGITFLDGEKGILRYRGYSIEELANKADFLEVAFLLIFGELPSKQELDKFHDDIRDNSIVDDDIRKILDIGFSPDEIFILKASSRINLSQYAIFTQRLNTVVISAF